MNDGMCKSETKGVMAFWELGDRVRVVTKLSTWRGALVLALVALPYAILSVHFMGIILESAEPVAQVHSVRYYCSPLPWLTNSSRWSMADFYPSLLGANLILHLAAWFVLALLAPRAVGRLVRWQMVR